ncbi:MULTISPECIES: VOC family protein [Microbacterium]|uniref:Glyoxylase CFP32 n=1 Tax=Microbacterium oxydans TaxID=82380 RepID=A0A3Q9J6M1_9MICO|nr:MULTISPECIES: VOC family protein [Microbacterium]AZS38912.1 Putative glyoxylase CFP32 [Microbacterium oxydans]
MSVRTEFWPHGTPNWVDLSVDDVEHAKTFYADLFGWEYVGGGEQSGGYELAQIGGRAVAGLGPRHDTATPAVWTTYFAAEDAEETAAAIVRAGGRTLFPVMDVMTSGRMTVAVDSVGAAFGVWQAGDHIGAERVNEHGALCWSELHTREYDTARAFYADVFGFEYADVSAEGMVYSTLQRPSDRRDVGGVHRDLDLPAGVPDHWLAWFASGDVDATIATAESRGAVAVMPALDTPFGRMAILRGAQGEVFGVIALPPGSE